MDEKEFVALVDELEVYANQNPGAYKLRIALLAALGYVFLISIVLIVLVLGDESGIKNIEVAMEKEVHAIPAGCDLIYTFLISRKRVEEAERYRRCITDYFKEIELAQAERLNVSANDDFARHNVAPEQISKLQAQLSNHPDVAIAYLVRKVVHYFPQEPFHVLGIVIGRTNWLGGDDETDQRLIDKLADEVTIVAFIVRLEKTYKPLRKVFEEIEGAEIYRAGRYKANKP